MRYSADEMEILEQNPYIRIVSPLTFVMEDSLYKSLFEEWMQDKRGATIEAGLVQRGIPKGMISDRYIAAVVWSFQGTNGYLRDRDIKSKANDVALVASGLFTTRREQVAWNPEFKKSLLDHYPKETFEDGILKAGLIPETNVWPACVMPIKSGWTVKAGLVTRMPAKATFPYKPARITRQGMPGNTEAILMYPVCLATEALL